MQKLLKIAQNGPKWLKNVQNVKKFDPIVQFLKMETEINTEIAENSSKWSKVAKNGQTCQKVGPNVQFINPGSTEKYKNCMKIAQNGPKWLKNVQTSEKLVPMCRFHVKIETDKYKNCCTQSGLSYGPKWL